MAVSSSVRQPESQLRKLPGSRNHGRKLYTTALILTFLLCISYLRGDLSDDPHRFSPSSSSPQSLVTRADHDAPNLQVCPSLPRLPTYNGSTYLLCIAVLVSSGQESN